MNAAGGGQPDGMLDAYLDDRLDAGHSGAFRDRLASDPELAAQLETQRRIDHALAERFVAPRYPGMPGDVLRLPTTPDRPTASEAIARATAGPGYGNQTWGVIWGSLIGAALFCLTWLLYTQLMSKSYSLLDVPPSSPQLGWVVSDAPHPLDATPES